MSHTKGPWSFSDETIREGLRSRLIHGMPEGMLAIVRVENQGAYYGEANARLIAAAPDLLEALKMAQMWLDWDGRYDMQGINAAIRKATGDA